MSDKLFDLMKVRRTYYAISNRSSISDPQPQTIVEEASLWEVVRDTYVKVVPGDDAVKRTACGKIDNEYAAGNGTVMFFEDIAVIDTFSERLFHMKAFFLSSSENSTGMLQFAVWTALSNVGLGDSLQHFGAYSPET